MELNFGRLKFNLMLGFHVAWLIFIYFFWPLLFYYPRFNYIYFPVMVGTLGTRIMLGDECWFKVIENNLRRKYAPATVYTDKCLPHYFKQWFGFEPKRWVVPVVFGSLFLLSTFLFVRNIL